MRGERGHGRARLAAVPVAARAPRRRLAPLRDAAQGHLARPEACWETAASRSLAETSGALRELNLARGG